MRTSRCSKQVLAGPYKSSSHSFRSPCRLLHSTTSCAATPLPQTAAGPPPKAPVPGAASVEERLARKYRQAELIKQGQELRAAHGKPATTSPLRKRFWKNARITEVDGTWESTIYNAIAMLEFKLIMKYTDGLQVLLDTRPVRITSRKILTLPRNKRQLAMAIALEWDLIASAQQALKHHYIPLTALAARAVDIRESDQQGKTEVRDSVVEMCMRYLTTDTLLCWAPETSLHDDLKVPSTARTSGTLRDLQKRSAQPILDFLTTYVWPGVEITPVLDADSILPKAQSTMTREVIRGWISGLPAFELAGLERAVLASKSLLVATRLLVEWSEEFSHLWGKDNSSSGSGRFGIEEARDASNLEVKWQTDMWGEVEDTHDVDKEDLRRQLGSVIMLVHGDVGERARQR